MSCYMIMLFYSFTKKTEFNMHDLHGVPSWTNERNTTIISSSPQFIVDKNVQFGPRAYSSFSLFFSWAKSKLLSDRLHFPSTEALLNSFIPLEWLASNFSVQYHSRFTHKGHENKGNDHQLKKLLTVKQILFVDTIGRKYTKNSVENMRTDIRV